MPVDTVIRFIGNTALTTSMGLHGSATTVHNWGDAIQPDNRQAQGIVSTGNNSRGDVDMSYFKNCNEASTPREQFLCNPIRSMTKDQITKDYASQVAFPKSCNLPPIKTRIPHYQQIRIVPQAYGYMCEIVYNYQEIDLRLNKDYVVGIDLGLENLITLVNNIGLAPIIIKGRMLKSINQFYNKINAQLQSVKDRQCYTFVTKKQRKLLQTRNHKINDIFHKVSRKVIDYCKENDCGTIVIGYNEGWKQEVNIGKRNNQNFVQIPYLKLIRMIQYKAKLVGITVIVNEESYTSKCSFLDNESIEKHEIYAGKRIQRGLFRTSKGQLINADVNAGYNIVKKAVPNAYAKGIAGLVLSPISVHFK